MLPGGVENHQGNAATDFTRMNNMPTDINANLSKCIQSVEHIGYTTYHNICSGAATDLAWGAVTWVGFFVIGAFLSFFLAVLVLIVREIWK